MNSQSGFRFHNPYDETRLPLSRLEMSQKEIFAKEVVEKVGEKVGDQSTTEKVEKFAKHGNLFLFFEVINLRQEIAKLKKEIKAQNGLET